MSTYLEKITAAQAGIDSFYRLLNIYKLSRLNNGWIGAEEELSNINLSKFSTYLEDSKFAKVSENITATLFDIPMSSRGYDKNGIYSAGIPSDIGFTKNVEQDSDGRYIPHYSLYNVTGYSPEPNIMEFVDNGKGSNNEIGGSVKYILDNNTNTLLVYPNGNTNPIIVKDLDSDWANITNYIFTISYENDMNCRHMIYIFAILSKDIGLKLYVTSNFITWNIHQVIPGSSNISNTEWADIISPFISHFSEPQSASFSEILEKYFKVLPNNNYLIMEPLPLYRGTDKSTMVKMYSPYSSNELLRIKDPYDTVEDYQDKAINGFTSYMTENGEVVLYYNNRMETPMVLYNGRTMGTFEGDISSNYAQEILESPKIAKVYDASISSSLPYDISINNMEIDCAINILDSKNGELTDIPSSVVSISLGDIGRPFMKHMADSVSLFLNSSIDMMNNIDVDFGDYISTKIIDGEDYLTGNTYQNNALVQRIDISNNNKLSIITNPYLYNPNIRYRITSFGNTLISGSKLVNNPSLGEVY